MRCIPTTALRLSLLALTFGMPCSSSAQELKPTASDRQPANADRILAQEVIVPPNVTYKKATRGVNQKAIAKLSKAFIEADPDKMPDDLFGSKLIVGAGLWLRIKDDDAIKKIQRGRVTFKVPNRQGMQVLEGKLFQTKDEAAVFWEVFRKHYTFDRTTSIRRPASDELSLFWSMIPYDIEEPIFMIDTKDATLLVHFENERLRIFWIDDFKGLSEKKSKSAAVDLIQLYIPIPQLENRFGKDVGPVANYMKALEKRTQEILDKEQKPKAKGLLIAVGIKSKKNTKIWCQAVEGDVPEELLRKLETELANIDAVDLKNGPAGFALQINLFGEKPEKFPEFPQVWINAATKSETKLIPPDESFKIIWPD